MAALQPEADKGAAQAELSQNFWQVDPVTGLSHDYQNEFTAIGMSFSLIQAISSAEAQRGGVEVIRNGVMSIKTYDDYLLSRLEIWNEDNPKSPLELADVRRAPEEVIRRMNELAELVRLTWRADGEEEYFQLQNYLDYTREMEDLIYGKETAKSIRITHDVDAVSRALEAYGIMIE